ncbi:MAG: hypothetical protein RLZZ400_147 [Actinomycetota bacterium]|jgi:hypothetical protein
MDKKQFKRGAAVAASAAALIGLVFATPTIAEAKGKSSSSSSASTKSTKSDVKKVDGHKDGHRDGDRDGVRPAPLSQVVTVTVPDDGKTYKLVVTEVKPVDLNTTTSTKPERPAHTFVVAVTGTGSVDVTVPGLRPGSYTVDLVAVSSTQTITVAAPVTPAPTPAPVDPTPAPTPAP